MINYNFGKIVQVKQVTKSIFFPLHELTYIQTGDIYESSI